MWGVGDFFWYLLWIFYFTAYIFMVFLIISDLFRDHKLNGWWKAVWIIFLIFAPFLTALVYVIARGKGMAERTAAARGGVVAEADDYRPAASSTPEIERARRTGSTGFGSTSTTPFSRVSRAP